MLFPVGVGVGVLVLVVHGECGFVFDFVDLCLICWF